LVNSLPSLAGLIVGIPIGHLSDRIGRKPAIAIGIFFASLAMLGQVTFTQPVLIAVMAALTGVFNMFLIVSISPLMMKLSDVNNRTLLFSLNYGLQTLAGAVGSLFAGQLPRAYGRLRSSPTRSIVKLATPNFLIGIGAAILIPYMNVFFKDRFGISDSWLGILFSLSSLFIGVGSLLGPRLTMQMGGKIRTIAFTQFASIVFLLIVGFWPSVWIAGIALLMRAALMNMAAPLYSAFCMEQTPEHQQGLVSSVLNIAWQVGWSVGPYLSGIVQEQYGFSPLFIATSILYVSAIALMWAFFQRSEEHVVTVAA
jgi:MFS family permease